MVKKVNYIGLASPEMKSVEKRLDTRVRPLYDRSVERLTEEIRQCSHSGSSLRFSEPFRLSICLTGPVF